MTSFLEELKQSKQTPEAKRNQILTSYTSNNSEIFILLEGRDDPSFIRNNVERIATEKFKLKVQTFLMGTKKAVIDAWIFFQERFPNAPRIMFFVDKDHDDFLENSLPHKTNENLFVTQYYSIENYLVSEQTLKLILIDFFGIDSGNSALQTLTMKFTKYQESYTRELLDWMAWVIVCRQRREPCQNSNFKYSNFSRLASIQSDYEFRITWNSCMETFLARQCNVNNPPELEEVSLIKSSIENSNPKTWLRGKQEIWCLILFLEKIKDEINRSENFRSYKPRSQICVENFVEIVAPRVPCPDDLYSFVQKRCLLITTSRISV
jgi:hypothetical protein